MSLESNSENRREQLIIVAACALLIAAVVWAYFPGLSGPFLLDDHDVLSALGSLGSVQDWQTFKAFVLEGSAGPTGRPVALLSFLADGNNWPTDAWPFKRSNLIIHLFNGLLLGLLVARLMQMLAVDRTSANWVALLVAATWLLHPFLVSTTLYVVQRMAQLATMFVLLGLNLHMYARSLPDRSRMQAYAIMTVSVVVCTALATLSKENGILLPLLVGVLEGTVIASQRARFAALDRRWLATFVVVPTLLVIAFIGYRTLTSDFFAIVPPRDFSLFERALTEPRILIDYLQNWFVPKLYTTGVFQDHFVKSTGIVAPVTTLLSVLAHAALIGLAVRQRKLWPLFSLAVLFFYAAHVLESTFLNLELYFEHRNYLAAVFLFLPVIVFARNRATTPVFAVGMLAVLLVLGGFTRYSATIWQDFDSIVTASANKAPTSARAQAQYATLLFNEQRYDESLQVIDSAIADIPGNDPLLQVNRLIMLCNLGILEDEEQRRVGGLVATKAYDVRSIRLYTRMVSAVASDRCPNASMASLRESFGSMLKVPYNADDSSVPYSHIQYFIGLSEMHLMSPDNAVAAFRESLRAEPGASHGMTMAATMASNGHYDEALQLADIALSILQADGAAQNSRALVTVESIQTFQKLVQADIDAENLTDID